MQKSDELDFPEPDDVQIAKVKQELSGDNSDDLPRMQMPSFNSNNKMQYNSAGSGSDVEDRRYDSGRDRYDDRR